MISGFILGRLDAEGVSKTAQGALEAARNGLKIAQDGPGVPQDGQREPKVCPRNFDDGEDRWKMASRCLHDDAKCIETAQDGLKMAQDGLRPKTLRRGFETNTQEASEREPRHGGGMGRRLLATPEATQRLP